MPKSASGNKVTRGKPHQRFSFGSDGGDGVQLVFFFYCFSQPQTVQDNFYTPLGRFRIFFHCFTLSFSTADCPRQFLHTYGTNFSPHFFLSDSFSFPVTSERFFERDFHVSFPDHRVLMRSGTSIEARRWRSWKTTTRGRIPRTSWG